MKSNLGKTLRKIRQEKRVSLIFVADEHLSVSQISRFERGESEISCARLINILKKLNVSLEEFLVIHENTYPDTTSLFSNAKSNPYERTMVRPVLHTVDHRIVPSDEEIVELTDYLFNIEEWMCHEMMLFGNCIQKIKYETAFLITKEIIKNDVSVLLNKNLVTQIAISCLMMSIEANQFENCHYLIQKISQLLENELNYYEKTLFLYAQGYFEFQQDKRGGKLKMQQALHVLELLEEHTIHKRYLDHYLKVVAN